jgi:hypothetical protein
VRKSVETAIADAEAELAGLQRRMKSDADNAGFLFGSAIESQTQGDPVSDSELRRSEQRITRGEQRAWELRRHIQHLRAIGESAARDATEPAVQGLPPWLEHRRPAQNASELDGLQTQRGTECEMGVPAFSKKPPTGATFGP